MILHWFFFILAQPLMLNRFIYYVKDTVVDLAVNRICRIASSNLLAVSDQWPRMPYEKQMPQACALLPWQQGTIKTLLEADHFKQMSKQQYNHLDTAIRRSLVWLLYQLDRNLNASRTEYPRMFHFSLMKFMMCFLIYNLFSL